MTSASTEPDKRRFAWLRPPQGGADGTMSLIDHLRELRYRVTVAASAIVVGAIVSAFFYNDIVRFVLAPWARARSALTTGLDSDLIIANNGVTQAFTVAVILCLVAGIFFSAPIWLWQVWAFVAPGLLAKEKKYSLAFVAVSLPLFFAGCALGYYVWPKGIEVLLSFTPQNMGITNILDVANFLSLEIKVVLVFGLSFLLPVVVVGLNMAGVVRGYQLKKARKMVIFGSVVLSAVATPTTDPFSMLALAVPITLMFLIAEVICRTWDKKRGISEETAAEFAIDLEDGK
ncbi:MAG TPA: twin-arginine translocase subunit TatC [Arachnia sp.]|jgi:sec-independent protein translocase protein TatC|nr:twin-arginine translocase subunit TatC [Propionibacteriaceae bacterium]HOA26864.1 twin-arginine translocase subunit TatC [Arachnia sp.]HQD22878.1 twin-arginine translocase subunit TatC [Arachnia sp.]